MEKKIESGRACKYRGIDLERGTFSGIPREEVD
jgi:hypothetical protein